MEFLTFHPFPLLPCELRLKIWEQAILSSTPRIFSLVELDINDAQNQNIFSSPSPSPSPPPLALSSSSSSSSSSSEFIPSSSSNLASTSAADPVSAPAPSSFLNANLETSTKCTAINHTILYRPPQPSCIPKFLHTTQESRVVALKFWTVGLESYCGDQERELGRAPEEDADVEMRGSLPCPTLRDASGMEGSCDGAGSTSVSTLGARVHENRCQQHHHHLRQGNRESKHHCSHTSQLFKFSPQRKFYFSPILDILFLSPSSSATPLASTSNSQILDIWPSCKPPFKTGRNLQITEWTFRHLLLRSRKYHLQHQSAKTQNTDTDIGTDIDMDIGMQSPPHGKRERTKDHPPLAEILALPLFPEFKTLIVTVNWLTKVRRMGTHVLTTTKDGGVDLLWVRFTDQKEWERRWDVESKHLEGAYGLLVGKLWGGEGRGIEVGVVKAGE